MYKEVTQRILTVKPTMIFTLPTKKKKKSKQVDTRIET